MRVLTFLHQARSSVPVGIRDGDCDYISSRRGTAFTFVDSFKSSSRPRDLSILLSLPTTHDSRFTDLTSSRLPCLDTSQVKDTLLRRQRPVL